MNSNTLTLGSILHSERYNYEIEKVLGQGTFGITYLAKVVLQGQLGQLDINAYVAVKEFFMKEINGREGTNVTSSSISKGGLFDDYKRKFAREAKNLSKLKHPNIVNVMDYFEENNTCYYVMEFLSGGDLDTLIVKRGGLGEDETIGYTKQIGAALSFMHKNKMLHLDLKPKNVMLTAEGEAILIDFGLSKQYDSSGEPESSTTVGGGTAGYAPLEQVSYQDGHGFPVTMDVYALGATMYKMLAGERAPDASEIFNDGFPTHILTPKCPKKALVACVEKAMKPMKKIRYQSVDDLLQAVNECSKKEMHNKPAEDTVVCEVPVLNDGGDWGFYDDFVNGNIVKRRITDHIPLPDIIKISKEESNTGKKYDIILHKNVEIKGRVSVVDVRGDNKQRVISGGIPDDVISYLKDKGFFSSTHWERYESTQEWTRDSVEVVFEYEGGGRFVRFSDAPDEGTLHRAVDGLIYHTSLDQYVSEIMMNDDFEPDDILNREETIYGGPPVVEQETEEKEPKKKSGCFMNILFLLAAALQFIYPAVWCLVLFSERLSYPSLLSVGIAWIIGIILFVMINDKGKNKEGLINLGFWTVIIIETAIVYYVNYL